MWEATIINSNNNTVRLDRQPSYANSPTANIQIQINDGYFKQGLDTSVMPFDSFSCPMAKGRILER